MHILDIGVGASCIYPFLGHRQQGWKFTGSDISEDALMWARQNVALNSLEEHIVLVKAADSNLFQEKIDRVLNVSDIMATAHENAHRDDSCYNIMNESNRSVEGYEDAVEDSDSIISMTRYGSTLPTATADAATTDAVPHTLSHVYKSKNNNIDPQHQDRLAQELLQLLSSTVMFFLHQFTQL